MTISYWECLWGHPGSCLSGHGRTINVSRAIHRQLLSSRVYQHIRAYRYSAIWEDISKDELSGRTILFSLSSTAGSAFSLHESTGPILSQSPLLNFYIARSLSSTRLCSDHTLALSPAHMEPAKAPRYQPPKCLSKQASGYTIFLIAASMSATDGTVRNSIWSIRPASKAHWPSICRILEFVRGGRTRMRSISVISHSFFYCSIQSNRYTASSFPRKSTTLLFTQHCALSPTHLLAMLSSHLRLPSRMSVQPLQLGWCTILSFRVAPPSFVNCSFPSSWTALSFLRWLFFFRPFFAMLFSLFHGTLFSSWPFSFSVNLPISPTFSTCHLPSCFWGRITPLVSLSSEIAGGLFISINFLPIYRGIYLSFPWLANYDHSFW